MRHHPTFAFAMALLAATAGLGGAVAGWSGPTGLPEPDTAFDSDGRRMWADAPATADERVYFNGFLVQTNGVGVSTTGTAIDPQVEGGSIVSPAETYFAAVLGYWRDCNGDGFMGMRGAPVTYGSFTIYSVAAAEAAGSPVDPAVCAPGSPYWPTNEDTGQANGYVDELRAIGKASIPGSSTAPKGLCIPPNQNPPTGICPFLATTEDPYDVSDPEARVWSDWGYPGSRHIPHQGLTAQPPGTYDDSDGTLKYVDDALQRTISSTLGGVWNAKPNFGECDAEPTFLGGPEGQCGLWPLYQVKRLTDDRQSPEEEATPLVTVWDVENDSDGDGSPCNDAFSIEVAGRTVAIPDPEVETNPNILVRGSLRGTLTNFARGTNLTELNGECRQSEFPIGGLESEGLDAEFTHRLPSDTLQYAPDQRYRVLSGTGFDLAPADFTGNGIRSGPVGLFGDFNGWFGGVVWSGRPPRTGFGSISVIHTTFYADVSGQAFRNNTLAAVTTALPAEAQDAHTYGVEYCDAFTIGASNVNPANDWECSTTVWEDKRQADYENAPTPDTLRRAIIGDKYDLRDVDCYDNSVSRENGVTGNLLFGVRAGAADCTQPSPQ